MHLGAASMIGATGSNGSNNGVPENFDVLTYTDNDLSEVSSIGYTVHNLVVNDPSIFSSDDIQRIKESFRNNSLIIGQTNGRYGGDLVNPDQRIRDKCINFVKDMCVLTSKLGAPNTYLRPGSINPNGPWLPHPENHTDKVFDRLIDSTKKIISVAENEGVKLSLEGGYVSPIFSAKRTKEFIDNAGTLVFASHSIPLLKQFCERGLVFNKGTIVFDGPLIQALKYYEQN